MKYVKEIGLEIEGGWFDVEDKPYSQGNWHADLSVRGIRHTQNGRNVRHIGEISTTVPLNSIEAAKRWIEVFWPDRKNESCGFHIHTSFEPRHYAYLIEEDFYIAFFHNMQRIGEKLDLGKEYFSRLNGENHHCQKVFKALEQIEARSKTNNRYTQLNFCYSLHGTLENRLPPAILKIGQAVKYLEEYINFLEDYLENHPKPELTKYRLQCGWEIEDDAKLSA